MNASGVYEQIELELERQLSSSSRGLELDVAARYMLFPGGKRLRPALALSVCADLGGDVQLVLPAAAAIEMLHVSTLIHDDLPDLDNDDFRRGRESCHKRFGSATAILTGDFLVGTCFRALVGSGIEPRVRVKMGEILAQAYCDICHGQFLDIGLCNQTNSGKVEECHSLKTAALFAASVAIGGLGANVEDDYLEKLTNWGRALGMAFQLIDDCIDRYGSPESRGRPSSSDARNSKINGANDIQAAESKLEQVGQSVRAALNELARSRDVGFTSSAALVEQVFLRTPFSISGKGN
ncbi:MAG: polyprenyl synthetase family protein [Oligoflexia bacterium]|nr:polyprenyl synthetase family protein [Oligoflexia bacterium]